MIYYIHHYYDELKTGNSYNYYYMNPGLAPYLYSYCKSPVMTMKSGGEVDVNIAYLGHDSCLLYRRRPSILPALSPCV